LKRSLCWFVAVASFGCLFVAASPAEAQDLAAKTRRVRELAQAQGHSRVLVPEPGSRSSVIAVDVGTGLFFFLERGSIRGPAVQRFYDALEAGDMAAASLIFTGNAMMTMRATDYGWNGLGTPWIADSGTEIDDILFKAMGGTFRRADSITDEDLTNYEGMLDAVLAALESSSSPT